MAGILPIRRKTQNNQSINQPSYALAVYPPIDPFITEQSESQNE